MNFEGFKGNTVFSLRTLDEPARWFRQFLANNGVVLAGGSAFSDALGATEHLAIVARNPSLHQEMPPDEWLRFVRDALGTAHMIGIFRQVEPWLRAVAPERFQIFRGPDVNLTRSAARSQERDFAWELLAAAIAAKFARDVQLVEPPDIRCRFRGASWGLAAKILYSRDVGRQIDAIVEGAKQVQDADVDCGLVVVNGTNLVLHEEFFYSTDGTRFRNFDDAEEAKQQMKRAGEQVFSGINTGTLRRRLTSDSDGRPRDKTRGVLVFLQTVIGFRGALASMSVCHFLKTRQFVAGEEEFWLRFHKAAQRDGFVPPGLRHWHP